jgi:molecular chaperone GrpE
MYTTDLDEHRSLRSAIAEYEAARKRVEREAAKLADETRIGLVAQLLPVLDSLDRSIEAADDPEGMSLVRAQLENVLRDFGMERFDALGAPFDPSIHEAMDVVPVLDPGKDGVVVAQWRAGYRVGARVVRPAQVQVGRLRRVSAAP